MLNLQTNAGNFDIAFEPAGFDGYDVLAARAVEYDIDGIPVTVAALDDVIRSKRPPVA